jgi:hypothetical protein
MTHAEPKHPITIRNYWKDRKREQRQRDREAKQKQDLPIQNFNEGENS